MYWPRQTASVASIGMTDAPVDPRLGRRQQLLDNLDRLVLLGRVSVDEAADLRSTGDLDAFEEVLQRILRRHMSSAVASAVAHGSLAPEDAERIGARLDDAGDPHEVSDLRRLGRRARLEDGEPEGPSASRKDGAS